MRVLVLLSVLVAAGWARPQDTTLRFGPSPVYSYRFTGPEQSKQEQRDALGNVSGSYRVTYPDGGGELVHTYSYPSQLPAFRTVSDGPLGPAGTIVSFGKNNPKDNAFLIEMLEQRLDSREPPLVTRTEAVLIPALPSFVNSKLSPALVEFQRDSEITGGSLEQELQLREPGDAVVVNAPATSTRLNRPFQNSKESPFLQQLRQESLEDENLTGRIPPKEGPEEIIVEAQTEA